MKFRYMREGRGTCKTCSRELDVLAPLEIGVLPGGPSGRRNAVHPLLIARHLARIEEYTNQGIKPGGFCQGSLGEPNPVKVPEGARHRKRR